ncbi:MAG: Ig-like domain-containing protein [Candidatus Krumholzibacteriia bacterium]
MSGAERRREGRRFLGLVALAALVAGATCARVRPLSGGPPDEEAPRLLMVTPADSSHGLPPQPEFHLQFDEKVSQTSVRRGLRFHPSVRRDEIRAKGKQIVVTLAESLPPDTTFVMVLGEAVQDLPPRNNKLAAEIWMLFSTGPEIRSAAVFGRVTVKGKPEPQGAVLYEPVLADTERVTPPPRYAVAAAGEEGLFRMLGIPPGRPFVLRAFLDRNDNLLLEDTELSEAYPETLLLENGEMRRGVQWNLIDPNEPGRVHGVALHHMDLDAPVAVALRQLLPDSTAAPADTSAADSLVVRADTLRPLPLPVAERATSGWEEAYVKLEPRGFIRTEWRVVYASPRGDYSVRVPPGRHALLAFVDASRDSAPGLYVPPDSTVLEWEPLWVGGVLVVEPGQEVRPRAIDIESDPGRTP